MSHTEYVLGTQSDELERLGFQHRLWSDAAHEVWKRAGIRRGDHVLDVGCGPGYASFDLAQFVGSSGRVVGVDESPGFIDHLNRNALARDLPHCHGLVGDVQHLDRTVFAADAPASFDLAWARWVLCFTPDPNAVIAGVAAALRPGGRFVIHDYFNYETMTAAPRRDSWTAIVQATGLSWRERGGDPDVMGRVPRMLVRNGLRLIHLTVHQRVARPDDSMWQWGETWWRNYVPRLLTMGEITPELHDQFFRDLDEMSRSETDFMVLPPVYEMIAERV